MSDQTPVSGFRGLALAAFDSAISHASEEGLWDLHGALEKRTHEVVRGEWGNREPTQPSACPLNWLFGREAGSLEKTIALAEREMSKDGFCASDFYQAWDRRMLTFRELLGRVDRHITARAMGDASRRA